MSGLTVAYHHKPVLWNVDFVAPRSGLIAIVGPNGAGKSTFIRSVLGLVPKLAGDVRVFGRSVDRQRRLIGYVPAAQQRRLGLPGLRAGCGGDGPLWPDRLAAGRCATSHREQARAYLDQVGMADFADRQIGQLSGGQQQRVFLARALAQDATLYFMDEPFAGVDAATERAIVDVLGALDAQGKTVICVHHDLQTAADYFDHVLILNVRVIADGTMAKAFTPDALQTAYGGRLAPSELAGAARTA